VKRVFIHLGGRLTDTLVFADVHGVQYTLHAYAEQLLRVHGREIIVFRKHMN
jgi:hypothetical protein